MMQSFTIRDSERRKQTVGVVFEDPHLLVINKPPGLRVVPDRFNPALPNLRDILCQRMENLSDTREAGLWVVHRIDADTSGLVLFTKTAEMHRLLNRMFEENAIRKTYLGIVQGQPPEERGEMDFPIDRHPSRKGIMVVAAKGKLSHTRYEVLERFAHFSLLKLQPTTGRTHQIRVHLQALGVPLCVDPLYGKRASIRLDMIKMNYTYKQPDEKPSPLMKRLSLHAWQLSFSDPISGAAHHFEAPPPKDFQALLKALRKWDAP